MRVDLHPGSRKACIISERCSVFHKFRPAVLAEESSRDALFRLRAERDGRGPGFDPDLGAIAIKFYFMNKLGPV
jgi:hypothetical protein